MSHFPDIITLKTPPKLKEALQDIDLFEALCRHNDAFQLEKDHKGNIIIMPPTYSETGHYNSEIAAEVIIWNRKTKAGVVFDSSTGFTLPNGAVRSPDVSWVNLTRWQALSPKQKNSFAPICPDFVIELLSSTDTLNTLHEKMEEWIANGCRLGWLIDLKNQLTYIYQPHSPVTTTPFNQPLSGSEVLPGFELILSRLP
ncbi:MAG TPA: Uma2 family endonuclease [Chitinophagales bacterium]|nr:Uma2 family endonuclease [Chitinophagales bacterium]HRK27474.1 Uma2 family endonuclease [Chitinophagales bacterium]